MSEELLSFWHTSQLGVAICDKCDAEWVCHSAAWGRLNYTSTHHICGGIVRWYPEAPPKEPSEAMKEVTIVVSDSAHYDMFQKESNEDHNR